RTLLAAGGAVPTAVLARVVMDGVRDPTAHNLWPLEIVIAGLVGLGCALAGALVGSALAATRTGRTSARAGAGS
ncbi:MAG TPA: hypothetical protein VFY16_06695, partial [Gemmatimonadaceae bacterium]|nr:hypothetical protein [Gemmatimonadaceae bacterium]